MVHWENLVWEQIYGGHTKDEIADEYVIRAGQLVDNNIGGLYADNIIYLWQVVENILTVDVCFIATTPKVDISGHVRPDAPMQNARLPNQIWTVVLEIPIAGYYSEWEPLNPFLPLVVCTYHRLMLCQKLLQLEGTDGTGLVFPWFCLGSKVFH